ncbi:MAG: flagellar FliJ family protein [Planctomycetia bacterium]|nr:flagellar FliJ family protein [Planctomycetia bacterium]
MSDSEFHFQAILKLRENTRDEKRNALELVLARGKELRTGLNDLDQLLIKRRNEWTREQRKRNVSLATLRFEAEEFDRLTLLREEQVQRIEACREEEDACRQALVEAQKEVRILEKLRERKEEEQFEEQRRRETRQLDETNQRLDRRP